MEKGRLNLEHLTLKIIMRVNGKMDYMMAKGYFIGKTDNTTTVHISGTKNVGLENSNLRPVTNMKENGLKETNMEME